MKPLKDDPAKTWLEMHREKTEKLINDIQKTFEEWKRAQNTPQHPTGQN